MNEIKSSLSHAMNPQEFLTPPPELQPLLRDFTKEVLNKRPKNLVQFAKEYFAQLASSQEFVSDEPAFAQIEDLDLLSQHQLIEFAQKVQDLESLNKDSVAELMDQLDFPARPAEQIAKYVSEEDRHSADVIVLAISLTGKNYIAIIRLLFETFGENGLLPPKSLLDLHTILTSVYPGDSTLADFRDAIHNQVLSMEFDKDEVSFEDFCDISVVQEYLRKTEES